MSDYNVTRTTAGKITDRFSAMLKDLEDDYEEEIVIKSLKEYYRLCVNSTTGLQLGVLNDRRHNTRH